MRKLKFRFFLDPIGNTICLWFKNPKEEVICDVDESGNILSLDKKGQVFGFEKINFLPQRFVDDLKLALKKPMIGELLLK